MENTEVPIENEDQVPEESKEVINQVIDDVSKNIEGTNGEVQITENQIKEGNVEKNDDEVVPSTTPKPIEEQENVTDTNTTVPPTSLSPGRVVPLKEVNESEKEEAAVMINGTENGISKKRELEQDDEPSEETTNGDDERTTVDQTKKIKICESTDTPIMETKETENNIMVNGTTAVEV